LKTSTANNNKKTINKNKKQNQKEETKLKYFTYIEKEIPWINHVPLSYVK
jgi:hypothetical protein